MTWHDIDTTFTLRGKDDDLEELSGATGAMRCQELSGNCPGVARDLPAAARSWPGGVRELPAVCYVKAILANAVLTFPCIS